MRNAPQIDPTSHIEASSLGLWTSIGARTSVIESVLGDYSYVMSDCQIIYTEIGKFCSIASHCRLNPPNHPVWRATSHHFTYRSKFYGFGEDEQELFNWRRAHKVVIDHDVWIGHGAIILPGVKIGLGAVVGAGAVVTKHVPPFTIVAGNPAKPIRRRFSADVEEALMKIQWWNWEHDQLAEALADFRYLQIEDFCKKYLTLKSRTAQKYDLNIPEKTA